MSNPQLTEDDFIRAGMKATERKKESLRKRREEMLNNAFYEEQMEKVIKIMQRLNLSLDDVKKDLRPILEFVFDEGRKVGWTEMILEEYKREQENDHAKPGPSGL